MKVYVSVDIEGVAGTTYWKECDQGTQSYEKSAKQMTEEALAAVEGALAAGADEIWLKDAHNGAINIDLSKLPESVRVIRGWSGDPFSMVEQIDSSFDAVLFVGYHSAAGNGGNPLSHTMSTSPYQITINDLETSEFVLFSYAAAFLGVPTAFLSGDANLCQAAQKLHPGVKTVAVKSGVGGATINLAPSLALKRIRETAEAALKQDLNAAKIELPEWFKVKVTFKSHIDAYRKSFYPGVVREGDHTLVFETDDYYEVLRMLAFVI